MKDLAGVVTEAKEVIVQSPACSPIQRQEELMAINDECLSRLGGVIKHCERQNLRHIERITQQNDKIQQLQSKNQVKDNQFLRDCKYKRNVRAFALEKAKRLDEMEV